MFLTSDSLRLLLRISAKDLVNCVPHILTNLSKHVFPGLTVLKLWIIFLLRDMTARKFQVWPMRSGFLPCLVCVFVYNKNSNMYRFCSNTINVPIILLLHVWCDVTHCIDVYPSFFHWMCVMQALTLMDLYMLQAIREKCQAFHEVAKSYTQYT